MDDDKDDQPRERKPYTEKKVVINRDKKPKKDKKGRVRREINAVDQEKETNVSKKIQSWIREQ